MADLYENRCKNCNQHWLSDFKEKECFKCKSVNVKFKKIKGVSIGNLIKGDRL